MHDIFTQQKLYGILLRLGIERRLFVAYSGGVDSHVLLHALVGLRHSNPDFELTAIHVNHGLNVRAASWAEHCRGICAQLGVPYILRCVDAGVKIPDHSPEEIARDLRYQVLAAELPVDACLVVAHHADDQAETLLLQLLRGAGPKGLAAMPELANFAVGKMARPLLKFSRQALLDYAVLHNLQWIEDSSNTNTKFARNYVRHELMPLFKQRWPGVLQTMGRVTQHCADADELLTVLAAQDYAAVRGEIAGTLSLTRLRQLSTTNARQHNVLRYWLNIAGLTTPSQAKMQQIMATVVNCRVDASPVVTWQGGEVRRYRDALHAMLPLVAHDNSWRVSWDLQAPLELPIGLGRLEADFLCATLDLDSSNISVRFRCAGEVFKFSEDDISHSLKKLLQEWGVPPWLRNRIPLLYFGDKIIAVIGYCIVAGWRDKIRLRVV